MIVHIIGSLRQFSEDIPYMLKIIEAVKHNNDQIALDWIAPAISRRQRDQHSTEQFFNWPEIVESNIKAALQADVLIVEGSRFNYSQGFQTALALEHNTPVLNLYREDLPEYKEWPDKLFVSGITHPLFTSKPYTTVQEVKEIVTQFLQSHLKKNYELDIKLILDDVTYRKLQDITNANHESQSSTVKDLLSRAISEKQDY